MGFTVAEFERILPAALNGRPYTKTPQGFQVELENGSLELTLSEQKFRNIASISMPYLHVDFSFEGLTAEEVETTMRFFNLRYQRGGG